LQNLTKQTTPYLCLSKEAVNQQGSGLGEERHGESKLFFLLIYLIFFNVSSTKTIGKGKLISVMNYFSGSF